MPRKLSPEEQFLRRLKRKEIKAKEGAKGLESLRSFLKRKEWFLRQPHITWSGFGGGLKTFATYNEETHTFTVNDSDQHWRIETQTNRLRQYRIIPNCVLQAIECDLDAMKYYLVCTVFPSRKQIRIDWDTVKRVLRAPKRWRERVRILKQEGSNPL